ncbi:MAG: NAD-dependent epimerase/dehydratase family protein [Lachnospiraceae bacterium]|nr:NAD-dependent epimerase/dehydratase family protein [Lachnospiraceae bacterium]
MKNIIITGATGALGMALVRKYLESGDRVFAVLHQDSARNDRLPEHERLVRVYCSMEEYEVLPDLLKLAGENDMASGEFITGDVFYHFAWAGTSGPSRNDMDLQAQNIARTMTAVRAASGLECHTFIGAGSQAEYGRVEGALTPETPCFPENGYGMAKLAAGQMTRKRCEELGIRHIWPRILSVYGPYDGEQSMVMSAARSFLAGVSPDFTAGEQQWDYLFAEDAAEILYRLAESGRDGQIYPVGSGEARPLADYIRMIAAAAAEVTGQMTEPRLGARPYAEKQVMYLKADVSAIERDLGLVRGEGFGTAPEEGIRKTVRWCAEHPLQAPASAEGSLPL